LIARRRCSKPVRIGNVVVGNDAPIVVQSMTKTDTRNIGATVTQIKELAECGCEVVRIAVPDMQAARAICDIRKSSPLPIISDIHFDYRLALAAINSGTDGLRLNPGNIQDSQQVTSIVKSAKERQIPIRIGLNAGSLPRAKKKYSSIAEHMVDVALEQIKLFESFDFDLIKVSLKAFDVLTTIQAYREIAAKMPYPLHLGITESGILKTGSVRSAVGIGILLNEGIGDTIRVSLSTHPCEEVCIAYEILKCLSLREHGPTLISCPGCGRSEIDIIELANSVDRELERIRKAIKVAVMGCVVNGPGEARGADIGIACGKDKAAIFRKGVVVSTVAGEANFLAALMTEVRSLCETIL
jgi:(E)-4-hydroxy-3-methylbut-2-enyl-diphosphate synthase